MLDYPEPLKAYPQEWVEELLQFKELSDQVHLERKDYKRLPLSSELRAFYERAEELVTFEPSPKLAPMPENSFTFLYIIPKKQHEIRSLAPYINQTYVDNKLSAIVDIGGGIGALAQTLNNQYQLNLLSVDMDPVLQEKGKLRQMRNSRHHPKMVEYHEHRVDESNNEFKKLLGPGIMSLGLHTCGDLSLHQMFASVKTQTKSLINFGCCYQRLEREDWQNVSVFAKNLKTKIYQNHFALTLAARAHRKTDEKDYNFKLKVKYYRYAMHVLLCDRYGHTEMATLGNSSKKLYESPFHVYATEQFKRLGLTPLSASEFEEFYNDTDRQELIRAMLTAGFIRNVFGRLLEAYILIDRAIFMEENGYDSKLLSFFDEEVSPRNLGLVCQLR